MSNFLRARDGACHAFHQRGHGQVVRRGGGLPSLLHRIERQDGAGNAQHHGQGAYRQTQPAVDCLPSHVRVLYCSWKVSVWMYCLPACGLPA